MPQLIIGIIVIVIVVKVIGLAIGAFLVTVYWIPANLVLLFEESLSLNSAIPPWSAWGIFGLFAGVIVAGVKEAPHYGKEESKPIIVGIPIIIFIILGIINISTVEKKIATYRENKYLPQEERITQKIGYTTANVNFRSGPGIENKVIGVLRKNIKVVYMGTEKARNGADWYKVKIESGTLKGNVGYVSYKYLNF